MAWHGGKEGFERGFFKDCAGGIVRARKEDESCPRSDRVRYCNQVNTEF